MGRLPSTDVRIGALTALKSSRNRVADGYRSSGDLAISRSMIG
jgi:hypothetical protein